MKKLTLFFVVLTIAVATASAQPKKEFWGMTQYGGDYSGGCIFKTDGNGNNQAVVYSFDNNDGNYPDGSLTEAPNGKLYGFANMGGGENSGVLFEFDPKTYNYEVKHVFTGDDGDGVEPSGSLFLASNNKLYGLTTYGGDYNYGTLFEFDPTTGIYTKKTDFDYNNGAFPEGVLLEEYSNGKLYGITGQGGDIGSGVLFEFDPVLGILTKKIDFDNIFFGGGNLTMASNGNLYGVNWTGGGDMDGDGIQDGMVFYYNPTLNELFIVYDFNALLEGEMLAGSLISSPGGKLWGMTTGGGPEDNGFIFEHNPATGNCSMKAGFNGEDGKTPYGSLLYASNGKIYGTTTKGGENDLGVLFEFEPSTNNITKKFDFEGINGSQPFYSSLIEICEPPRFTKNVSDINVCEGQNTKFIVSATGNELGFQWQSDSGSGFTNLTDNAIYSGTNNDTLNITGADSTMSGLSFRCIVTSSCPAISVISDTGIFMVNDVYSFTEAHSICTGSLYLWHNNIYSEPGTYYTNYTSQPGCDSTYRLDLTILPDIGFGHIDSVDICNGDIYPWHGNLYSTTGIYIDENLNIDGCDSTYILYLFVNPTYSFTQDLVICEGSSYLWHDSIYSVQGVYQVTYPTAKGCDSTYILNLSVIDESLGGQGYTFIETAEICEGSSYLWKGSLYSQQGIYADNHYTYNSGCDSSYFLKLTVNPGQGYSFIDDHAMCEGENYVWQGNTYNEEGVYAVNFLSHDGCDSSYFLNLLVHASYHIEDYYNAAEGDTVSWRGNNYFTPGTYTENFVTVSGCDSICVLHLSFFPIYEGPDFNEIWGMTMAGGSNNLGCIFKTDRNGENEVVVHSFDVDDGTNPYGSLLYASNHKLYGMTSAGGANDMGTLFEYDLASETYTVKINFNGSGNGASPRGGLIEGNDGLLYGMTYAGGLSDEGVVFSYNPVSGQLIKLVDFNLLKGSKPTGNLLQASNGKLYGVTSRGGNIDVMFPYGLGVLFEFDLLTKNYYNLFNFNISFGFSPVGSLIEPDNNGLIYGTTNAGPVFDAGIIYSFNIYEGSSSLSSETYFSGYEPDGDGRYPACGMIETPEEYLIGTTSEGGPADKGTIYFFDPSISEKNTAISFSGTSNGAKPLGPLMKTCDGRLFGMTSEGGTNNTGVLYFYEYGVNNCIKKIDFTGPNGANPQYTQLIEILAPVHVYTPQQHDHECAGGNAEISIIAEGNDLQYQWQEYNGAEFHDIHNNVNYYQTDEPMLIIWDVNPEMDGMLFRCVVTSSCPEIVVVSDTIVLHIHESFDESDEHRICQGKSYAWHGSNYNVQGTYYAYYHDQYGCDSTYILELAVDQLPDFNAGEDVSVCPGEELVLLAEGSASEYLWNHGVTDGVSFIAITPGTYVVTGTDEITGCSNTDSLLLTIRTAPVVYAGEDISNICPGDSVTLTASGNADEYWWSDFQQDGVPFPVVSSSTFILYGYNSSTGCQSTDSVNVTVKPLVVDAGSDKVVCPGSSLTLTANGNADSWTWDHGVNDGVSFVPLVSDLYGLTGTSTALGCTYTDYVWVEVTPVIIAVPDMEVCPGESVTLYSEIVDCEDCWVFWGINGYGMNPNGWTVQIDSSAQFILAVFDFVSQCGLIDTVTVTMNPFPEVSAGPDFAACEGNSITMTGIGNAHIYNWNNGVIDDVIFSAHTPGNYVVDGIDTITGCSFSDTVFLTVNPNPSVFAGADIPVCEGNAVILAGSGTAEVYTWNNGITNGVAFYPDDPDEYIVTGTNLSTGCFNIDSMYLTVLPLPLVSAGPGFSVCAGDYVILSGSGNADHYLWNNGVLDGVPFIPGYPEIYTVTGVSSDGCVNSDMVVVNLTVPPNPTIIGLEPLYCIDHDPVYLFGVPSGGIFSGPGISGSTFDPVAADTGTFEIIYTYTDDEGCTGYDTVVTTVDGCAGINTNSFENGITLIPNPTNGMLYLNSNAKGIGVVNIYNSIGSIIFTSEFQGGEQLLIDIRNQTPGIYLAKVDLNKTISVTKIVKL